MAHLSQKGQIMIIEHFVPPQIGLWEDRQGNAYINLRAMIEQEKSSNLFRR